MKVLIACEYSGILRNAFKKEGHDSWSSASKICIENPIGIMSTRYRKLDQIIQPFQFGHPESKATCLWLKNLPRLIPTAIVKLDYTVLSSGKKIGKWYSNLNPSKRAKDRSRTFDGIARAMAEHWGKI